MKIRLSESEMERAIASYIARKTIVKDGYEPVVVIHWRGRYAMVESMREIPNWSILFKLKGI